MSLENDEIKLEVIRLKSEGLSSRTIGQILGLGKTTVNDFLAQTTYVDWWQNYNDKPIASGEYEDHHKDIEELSEGIYLITSAQNNTFVHYPFLQALEVAAEHLDAEIIVGTFSYNKTGFQNLEKGEGDWFDSKITKYIKDRPVKLAQGLMFLGELNILPTAVNPFSGLQSYAKNNSAIIPHAKLSLESLPRLKGEDARFLYSTGCITKRNYIQKKSGQKGSFDHVYSALIVEVDKDGDWFVRQIISDEDGSFYDLDTLYTKDGVVTGQSIAAIQYGDIHAEKVDEIVQDISWSKSNPDSILNKLKPAYQFVHDVLDHSSRNHHNIKDPYFRFMQFYHGRDSVVKDLRCVKRVLERMNRDYCTTVIVESNHDLALQRWLKEADYKSDPQNAILFLTLQLATYEAMYQNYTDFQVFRHALEEVVGLNHSPIFLKTDQSFKLLDVEFGFHGHLGANGSRGTPNQFLNLGVKTCSGHTHSCSIKSGVYVAGTSSKLDMGYNKGMSSWSHSHIILYKNGKRAIVTIKNGKYRGEF